MAPDRDEAALKRLLADDGWARDLARHVAGPDRADDLVQEAWLAALAGRRPRGCGRAWLTAVVRNLARLAHRREARLARRERRAALGEGVRGTADLAERAEVLRRLDEAVRDLPEPARSTVRLHFHGGWSLAEIARREGVPSSTVRNRLRRALAALRQRLRAEFGGDRPFLAAAPLALAGRPRLGPWAKAAAAAALLGGVAFAGTPDAAPPPPPPAAEPVRPSTPAPARAPDGGAERFTPPADASPRAHALSP